MYICSIYIYHFPIWKQCLFEVNFFREFRECLYVSGMKSEFGQCSIFCALVGQEYPDGYKNNAKCFEIELNSFNSKYPGGVGACINLVY